MALPKVLKDMMLYNEGQSYLGQVVSVTIPKLGRKFEGHRGGGMDSEVKLDVGGDYGDLEFESPGYLLDVLRQHAMVDIAGVGLRFRGAYQSDETGGYDAVDIAIRGRHEEIDFGEQKPGEKGSFKVKTAWTYMKIEVNGRIEFEHDKISNSLVVDGVDRMLERRQALGLQ